MADWEFSVIENGSWVAGGNTPDKETAIREAGHYCMMYGQDGGDVRAYVYEEGKPPKELTQQTTADTEKTDV